MQHETEQARLGARDRPARGAHRRRCLARGGRGLRHERRDLLRREPRELGHTVAQHRSQRRRCDLRDERFGLRDETRASFGARHVDARGKLVEEELRERFRPGERGAETVRALAAHERVRVVFRRQEEEAHHLAVGEDRQRHLERAPRGLAAGGVAVEAEDDVVGEAQQLAEVEGRGRRTEGCDRVLDAVLRERDDVHVALDHDDFVRVADRAPRLVEAVELATLLEERRFGRVQVFRLARADDAPAEADDVAARIEDREHHAIAEAVVAARSFFPAVAAVAVDHQARVLELRGRVVGEHALEVLPALGREAEPVARGDLARDAAALEIVDRGVRLLELRAVIRERVHHARGECRRLGRALLLRARLGDRHADRLGKRANRLGIGEPLVFHEEADGVAVRAAAEAVVELLRRAHREGWRLLGVERAAGAVVRSRLLELHVPVDHVDDVDAREQGLDELLRDHGGIIVPRASP